MTQEIRSNEEQFIKSVRQIRTASFIAFLAAERRKGRAAFQDPDWIWKTLIEAAITLGRVPRKEVLTRSRDLLTWPGSRVSDELLQSDVQQVYRDGGVRFPARKAGWAVHNRRLILEHGGTVAFKDAWVRADFATAIEMLYCFTGVREKYARNIGMLAADPRFEDCAALDVRILNLARHVNPKLPDRGAWYRKTEEYLCGLARRLGISLWQLDRTMFWGYEELSQSLGYRRRASRTPGGCKGAR